MVILLLFLLEFLRYSIWNRLRQNMSYLRNYNKNTLYTLIFILPDGKIYE